MIVKVEVHRCLKCTICGEVVELRERTAVDVEKVLLMVEAMAKDHESCEKFNDDPRRAKAERAYKVGMREEAKKVRRK